MNTTITSNESQFASPALRISAAFIDSIVINIAKGILLGIIGPLVALGFGFMGELGSVIYIIFNYLAVLALSCLYFAFLESSKLQGSIGKVVLGLRVVSESYERISLKEAITRYIFKLLSALFLMLGFLSILTDEKRQGFHDKQVGTLVVKNSESLKEMKEMFTK